MQLDYLDNVHGADILMNTQILGEVQWLTMVTLIFEHWNGRPIEIYRYSGSGYKKNTLEYHKERSRSRIDIQYDKQ